MLKLSLILIAMTLYGGSAHAQTKFDEPEKAIITSSDGQMMRILTADDDQDLATLRMKAAPITRGMLRDKEYDILKKRMIATVNDPQNPGVGIAAPQVGVSRRLIAVQRVDKPGEPFEFYVNPEIIGHGYATQTGIEGCLSIPNVSGTVERYSEITIRYCDERTFRYTEESVTGFAAVIFQHEIDHLDGILFIDRMIETAE